jgi:hypothetical protein
VSGLVVPRWWVESGGVEGHGVAQGLQLTDVLADLALRVGAGGVVVRAEVDELGLVVGEEGSVRAALTAASPTTRARSRLPLPVPARGPRTDPGVPRDKATAPLPTEGAGYSRLWGAARSVW